MAAVCTVGLMGGQPFSMHKAATLVSRGRAEEQRIHRALSTTNAIAGRRLHNPADAPPSFLDSIFATQQQRHLKERRPHGRSSRAELGSPAGGSQERKQEEMAGVGPEEKAEMERIFKRFDTNGDGKISSAELGEVLRTLGAASPDEVRHMMQEIDTDGDGFIDYSEFSNFYLANRGIMKDVAKVF